MAEAVRQQDWDLLYALLASVDPDDSSQEFVIEKNAQRMTFPLEINPIDPSSSSLSSSAPDAAALLPPVLSTSQPHRHRQHHPPPPPPHATHKLFAVVAHMGYAGSGHYVTYLRYGDLWFRVDNENSVFIYLFVFLLLLCCCCGC